MSLRVLIDLQSAQNGSAGRGIGRYATSLTEAMLDRAEAHGTEVHLLLNGAFERSVPGLQRRFASAQEAGRIHVFPALAGAHPAGTPREALSASIRDGAIRGLSPDVVFVPSVFDGAGDDMVLSPPGTAGVPEVATLHDLIPLAIPEHYLDPHPDFAAFYRARLDWLKRYDRIIAVSEAARDDGIRNAGIDPDRIRTVLEDAGPSFAPPDLTITATNRLRARYGLDRPYLLYTGAADPRKNVFGLIEAYGALPREMRARFDLVIAGQLVGHEPRWIAEAVESHGIAPGRVRTLGFVPDSDLPMLYALAEVFVMPSLYEGFGLPALEAMRCGTLALGSDRTSLPEVIVPEAARFDPTNTHEMAECIRRGLTDAPFRRETIHAQAAHAARFSWSRAADETLETLREAARPARLASWEEARGEIAGILGELEVQARDVEGGPEAVAALGRMLHRARRPRELPSPLPWRLEGPFDSTYSLALVNRETALALERSGAEVSLVSAEGPGAFDPDPAIFDAEPSLAEMHARAGDPAKALVTTRNMFPPRVHDMASPFALLHGYAWEETGLPPAYVSDFLAHLDGVLVTAPHVKKVFEDQGVDLPIHVVGNGIDHLDRISPEPLPEDYWPEGCAFRLLHVSSGFPRKGADVLLRAYAEAFDGEGDVALVIKTHPNPHNDLAKQIEALRAEHPGLPPIRLVEEDLSAGQMRSLYAEASALAVPSRAEGFCLPVAEAVLMGTPVVTTGWSGQMIFAGNPLVRFCDFAFAPAASHLGAWDSAWAEPDAADLARHLREMRAAPDTVRAESAAADLRQTLSWDRVAERSIDAVRTIASAAPMVPPKIGWVSTFNAHCGIATYSGHLIDAIPDQVTVFAAHAEVRPVPDTGDILRCWHQGDGDDLSALGAAIAAEGPEAVVIQFNFGLFSIPCLELLVEEMTRDGRRVVMMMHATDDTGLPVTRRLARLRRTLEMCDLVLVHSVHDLNRLKAHGILGNVALFPHGVPSADVPDRPRPAPDAPLTLATYGFMLPQKGFPELVDAVGIMRGAGRDVRLKLVNSDFPDPVSARTRAEVRARIEANGLHDHVDQLSDFLTDAESFAHLAAADLLVFPYRPTQESASGAIRQALAVGRPVAVTPLPIFDDVASCVSPLPGADPEAMAEGLSALQDALTGAGDAADLDARQETAAAWRAAHAYETLGPRLWRQIRTLMRAPCPSEFDPS